MFSYKGYEMVMLRVEARTDTHNQADRYNNEDPKIDDPKKPNLTQTEPRQDSDARYKTRSFFFCEMKQTNRKQT